MLPEFSYRDVAVRLPSVVTWRGLACGYSNLSAAAPDPGRRSSRDGKVPGKARRCSLHCQARRAELPMRPSDNATLDPMVRQLISELVARLVDGRPPMLPG